MSIVTVFQSSIVYKTNNIVKSVNNVKWDSLTRENGKNEYITSNNGQNKTV